MKYRFECGCELPILGESVNKSGLPLLDIDFYNLRLDCPGTWGLIGTGMTKGIFQVESQLGRQWSKEIKPGCIEDMSAISALLRPGCLKSFLSDGHSMTQHYADRKNNKEPVTPYHPAVDNVLKDTFSLLLYQEQSMILAKEVAGFTLVEADMLRKAIGKKKADEMAKVKKMFLEKAATHGVVTKEQAEEIFGWIESSQRYAFNKCLSFDTEVITENGKILAYDAVGKKILCPTNVGTNDFRLVKDRHFNGVKPMYRVVFDNYCVVECTIDHKFLCKDNELHPLWYILHNRNGIIASDKSLRHVVTYISDITYIGRQETIDLEIDDSLHCFYTSNVTNNSSNYVAVSNSHSVEYGYIGYWTAYAKYHQMNYFLTANLANSRNKINSHEEVQAFVSDARYFDIEVKTPKFKDLQKNFYTNGQTITFGLHNIKNVGASVLEKINNKIPICEKTLGRPLSDWTWLDILLVMSQYIDSKAFTSIINVGGFDGLGLSRARMVYEYEKYRNLSDGETDWIVNRHIQQGFSKLDEAIRGCAKLKKEGGGAHTAKKVAALLEMVNSLQKPPFSLEDMPDRISFEEKTLLGASITYALSDVCEDISANTTCKELLQGKKDDYMAVLAKITRIKEHTVSKGKSQGSKMAFLTITDDVCSLDNTVAFTDEYKKYRHLLVENNTVILRVERSKQGSLVVKKVSQC